jgi:AmmeMemoRadiSam system protein A
MEAAYQAAFHDPRFSPLTEEEYKLISIEISILSEPFPLNNYDDIVVGEHGLILEEENKRGLLLPQVPIEHNMNKEEYLSALCNKAGFPPYYWKEKQLKLFAFTATVFSEKDEGLK